MTLGRDRWPPRPSSFPASGASGRVRRPGPGARAPPASGPPDAFIGEAAPVVAADGRLLGVVPEGAVVARYMEAAHDLRREENTGARGARRRAVARRRCGLGPRPFGAVRCRDPRPAPDGTPASADFFADAVTDGFVSQLVVATVIAYDDRAFPGEKLQTGADRFDVERFFGERAWRAAPVGLFEWALAADGVSRRQIQELLNTERGFRLAFRCLDRIRADLVWWRGGAVPPRLLADGEVAMASSDDGRFFRVRIARAGRSRSSGTVRFRPKTSGRCPPAASRARSPRTSSASPPPRRRSPRSPTGSSMDYARPRCAASASTSTPASPCARTGRRRRAIWNER